MSWECSPAGLTPRVALPYGTPQSPGVMMQSACWLSVHPSYNAVPLCIIHHCLCLTYYYCLHFCSCSLFRIHCAMRLLFVTLSSCSCQCIWFHCGACSCLAYAVVQSLVRHCRLGLKFLCFLHLRVSYCTSFVLQLN